MRSFDVASLLRKDAALESYLASYLSSSYQDDQSFCRSYKLCDVACVVVSENDRNQSHRMFVTVFTVLPSANFHDPLLRSLQTIRDSHKRHCIRTNFPFVFMHTSCGTEVGSFLD